MTTPSTFTAPAVNEEPVTRGLLRGDCLELLRGLPTNSVDAVVTDPPYGLREVPSVGVAEALQRWISGDTTYIPEGRGFMGKAWDSFVPPPAAWAECLRVLKPGGHLLAFGGTRTYDLLTIAMRLAGFEIRDSIDWLYAQGMPMGGNLKPAHEPIVVARKPIQGSRKENVAQWGTGALNVDACRIPTGRYPANLVITHSRGCAEECVTGCPAELLDQQSGTRKSGMMRAGTKTQGYDGPSHGRVAPGVTKSDTYGDTGGASRFFTQTRWTDDDLDLEPFYFQAKPSKAEKNAGLEHLPVKTKIYNGSGEKPGSCRPGSVEARHSSTQANFHSTVKPVELMLHLIRLSVPEGGVVLDPFLGSGTTAVAAIHAGREWIGCELTEEYWPIIEGRVARAAERAAAACAPVRARDRREKSTQEVSR